MTASGWTEVPAVTIAAAAAHAVRWTGREWGWGQSVLQIERAIGADHVWLHASSQDDAGTSPAVNEEGAELTLPDLVSLRQQIDETITAILAERAVRR
jgi:hypothetical protein